MQNKVVRGKELSPTKDNIRRTLLSDELGRNEHVCNLARNCCEVEHGAISLDAAWGEGKTFIVKQAKMLLDAYNPNCFELSAEERSEITKKFNQSEVGKILINQPLLTVYYDAWLHDGDMDPALSLAYEVACATKSEAMLEADSNMKSVLGRIAGLFGKKEQVEAILGSDEEDLLSELKSMRKREETMKNFFQSVLPERGERLVIFVDELDRCNPPFAVRLLERIKHFFDEERIVFIFSINATELAHAIKKHYGEQFDATRYLSRFFSLTMSLPKVDRERFLESQFGTAVSGFTASWYCFCMLFDLSLRDILRMQSNMERLEKTILDETEERYNGGVYIVKNIIVPVAFGLRMFNRELYEEFVAGKNDEPLSRIALSKRLNYMVNPMKMNTCTDEDMIKQIYSVVFGGDREKRCEYNGYVFTGAMKDMVLRLASQLSRVVV